jgi:hypothetical protein
MHMAVLSSISGYLPVILLWIAACCGLCSTAHCGMWAGTGMPGSKHDLNMFTQTPDPQGRVCIYCHIPHHAEGGTLFNTPLWEAQAQAKYFLPYNTTTFDSTVTDPLIGPSRMCLTCHDGSIAADTHPNLYNDNYNGAGVGVGSNLSNDHPIGMDYYESMAKHPHDFNDPNERWLDGIMTVSSGFYNARYVTCATCHDMHNQKNVADPANTYNYFIYSRQANSSLCRSCHNK